MTFFNKIHSGFLLLLTISTPNTFATDTWRFSTDSNCKIYNPKPQLNETITWSGKCVDGYAQGYGKVEWFVNNELHSTYTGNYQQGHAHGKGKVIYANGNEYVGDWKDSKMHGKGTAKSADNGTYIGDWKENQVHGKGLLITPFAIYYGDFVNNEYDGWGVRMSKDDGMMYEGQFKDGVMNGVGRFLFVNDGNLDPEHKKYGYLQDNYVIRPAIFKDGRIDRNLTKEQYAKAVHKLGKKVQRPKEVLSILLHHQKAQ